MHLFGVESLHQLAIALAGERSPEAALRRCARWVAEAPGGALARVWLLESGKLVRVADAGSRRDAGTDEPGEEWIGRMAAGDEPLRVENLQGDPRWQALQPWARAEGVVGLGAVPLAAGATRLGLLVAFRRRPLDRAALASLATAAAHLAAAVERGRAFADLERRRRALVAENAWLRRAVLEGAHARPAAILTESQLRDLERENTRAALRRCRGRLYGEGGAARLLGVSPTTLASRLKKMRLAPRA